MDARAGEYAPRRFDDVGFSPHCRSAGHPRDHQSHAGASARILVIRGRTLADWEIMEGSSGGKRAALSPAAGSPVDPLRSPDAGIFLPGFVLWKLASAGR